MAKITMTPNECLEQLENYLEQLDTQDENILRLFGIIEGLRDWCEGANNAMEEAEGYLNEIENICFGGISGPNETITITI